MKVLFFVSALSSALFAANVSLAADTGRGQPASELSATPENATSAIALAEAVKTSRPGSDKSIIIVSGRQSHGKWVESRGSKVMLNPQPLPPRESMTRSR